MPCRRVMIVVAVVFPAALATDLRPAKYGGTTLMRTRIIYQLTAKTLIVVDELSHMEVMIVEGDPGGLEKTEYPVQIDLHCSDNFRELPLDASFLDRAV